MWTILKRLTRWLHARTEVLLFKEYATSYTSLGLFRIAYALTFIVLLGIPQFSWLGQLPDFMYYPPPGIARLFTGFPNPLTIQVINVLIVIALLAVLIGWQTHIWTYIFFILVILCKSWSYSLGKIDHDILVWLAPLCLGWHWGRKMSVDALLNNRYERYEHGSVSWPVTFFALFLAFGYFTSAVPKILGGWLDPSFSMFKSFLLDGIYNLDRTYLLALPLSQMQSHLIWELFDWLAIIFEVGFLFVLVRVNIFRVFTVIAVFFHLFVYLTMNIPFTIYISVYPLFWIPILLPHVDATKYKRTMFYVLGVIALLTLANYLLGWEITLRDLSPDQWDFNLLILAIYSVFGLMVLVLLMIRNLKKAE